MTNEEANALWMKVHGDYPPYTVYFGERHVDHARCERCGKGCKNPPLCFRCQPRNPNRIGYGSCDLCGRRTMRKAARCYDCRGRYGPN